MIVKTLGFSCDCCSRATYVLTMVLLVHRFSCKKLTPGVSVLKDTFLVLMILCLGL